MGMLGRDAAGAEYRKKLSEHGVDGSLLLESPTGAPTGTCLCLVSLRTACGSILCAVGARKGSSLWHPFLEAFVAIVDPSSGSLLSPLFLE